MPQVDLPPLTNKLHSYPSYIYSLSWHLLSEEEYNDIVVTQQYTPKNVMIAMMHKLYRKSTRSRIRTDMP